MATWFECKIKYDATDEYGKLKSISEIYLIDAFSFTEAEQRLYKIFESENRVNFVVSSLKMARVDEIIPSQTEDILWFKARITYLSIDEKSGKEQKIENTVYVAGKDIFQALESLKTNLSTVLLDWTIDSITTTKILDVYPYEPLPKEDNKQKPLENLELYAENRNKI